MNPVKMRNDKLGEKVVDALKKRFFDAYYVSTKEEVQKKVLELIPSSDVISWGGSMSVDALGVKELLKSNGNKVIDRDTASTPEERVQLMRDALICDTFLMGTNAITEKGELFNVDSMGNRVAALCYGPKNVLIIAGINKVVKNLDSAYDRARNFAAPINAQRFCKNTPCAINGACGDCVSQESICAQMVATRFCKPEGRIKVILVGEDLGL